MLQAMTTKIFVKMILAAMIVVTGCQTIELSPSVTDIDNCTSSLSASTKVTPTHLAAYINGYKGIPKTRSADVSIDPILNGTDTVMYLVNYPEGGWEVLSADLRVPKVLVMCEGGSMTVEDLASNPAEEDLYGAMGDYISYLHDNPDLEVTDSLGNWSDVSHQTENMQTREIESWVLIGTDVLEEIIEEQDHLTQTRWGQGNLYSLPSTRKWNYYSPRISPTSQYRCFTGCVPVAIAQMMYYTHYKLGTPATYYNDFTVSTYIPSGAVEVNIATSEIISSATPSADWDYLPLEVNDNMYSENQYRAVSSIMTYIGYSTSATYSLYDGTSVTVSKIKPFFNSIGINCNGPSSTDWEIIAEEIFNRDMPVLLSVYTANGVGHRVIVDGLSNRLKRVVKRYVWNSLSGPQYKTETEYETLDMVCFNWGYEDTGMVSSSGDTIWYNVYDSTWSAGEHDYIESRNMIYGFTD